MANHLTQRWVRAARVPNTTPLLLLLPALASISGELKSCFMDGIHGGCGFLITADLHVLLGTDCTARLPPTWCQSVPIRGCLEGGVVQNQQADADYTFSRYNGADLHVSLSFLFSFSYPAAWNESRDTWVFCYLQSKDNRTAVWEVFRSSRLVFAEVFRRMQKLTDFWELWLFSHFHLLSEISAVSIKFFPRMKENITFWKTWTVTFNAACNQDKLMFSCVEKHVDVF